MASNRVFISHSLHGDKCSIRNWMLYRAKPTWIFVDIFVKIFPNISPILLLAKQDLPCRIWLTGRSLQLCCVRCRDTSIPICTTVCTNHFAQTTQANKNIAALQILHLKKACTFSRETETFLLLAAEPCKVVCAPHCQHSWFLSSK